MPGRLRDVVARGHRTAAAHAAGAAQHRDHVSRQSRVRRSGHLWWQSRRADAAPRRPRPAGHAADELQRRDVLHAVACGAPHRPLRRAIRHARLHPALVRHDALGDDARRTARATRLHERALRQVALGKRRRTRADAPGLRRVVRHPRLEQRVAAQHDERHALHLGGQGRRAVTPGQGVQPRDTPHPRSRGHRAGGRLHERAARGPASRSSSTCRSR